MGSAIAQPMETDGTVSVKECAHYRCDLCPKEVHIGADEGMPEGWGVMGPTFQHPDSRHICNVCMGPLKKMMDVFQEARRAFLEACEVAGKGKLSGAEMAQGLIGDWEQKGEPLL